MRERLRGYADAVLETSAADVATIAGQLQGFSDLLAGSTDLHWALASPATALPAKRTILQQLLAKKVSAPVLDLLTFTLENAGDDDFGEDVNALAVAATARQEGKVLLDEGPLGRLGRHGTARGVRSSSAGPGAGRASAGRHRGRAVPFRPDRRKATMSYEWPSPRVSFPPTSGPVWYSSCSRAVPGPSRPAWPLMRAGSAGRVDFPVLLDALVQLVAKETNRRMADVRSAVELTTKQRSHLMAALTKFTGYPVDVRITPEPDLLGGFVATIGDLVIDTSLRHRLEQARELLLHPAPMAGPRPSTAATDGGSGTGEAGKEEQ